MRFHVAGTPAPKGSKRVGRAGQLYEASPHLEEWTAAVKTAAFRWWADTDEWLISAPVRAELDFTIARPRSHYRPDGSFQTVALHAYPKLPDLDKLCRATLDALIGGLLEDDSQVVELRASKRYGPAGGCDIALWRLSL